jgi:acetolactate synthase-1/2/3 large subunit
MIDIGNPRIDWVAMGTSMGVPSERVTDAAALTQALVNSAREPGPRLIEVLLA